MHRALTGFQKPFSCQACARLPGPPEQGCAGLGDGIQLLKPQPRSGSSFALEGTIKKHFALQLKSLIKITEHMNGEGKKGSAQFSPFAIAFLLNSQIIPGASGRSVGPLGVPLVSSCKADSTGSSRPGVPEEPAVHPGLAPTAAVLPQRPKERCLQAQGRDEAGAIAGLRVPALGCRPPGCPTNPTPMVHGGVIRPLGEGIWEQRVAGPSLADIKRE